MSTFRESIELARKSEYFSGARLPEELGAFLSAESDACRELGRRLKGVTHVYLVGSGGSWATLQTAKYALDGTSPRRSRRCTATTSSGAGRPACSRARS